MLGICYRTLISYSLLFVNKVLVFLMFRGVYPHGVALESYFLCFEIPKHTRETSLCFVCF
jgi:hypothetical protein